MLMNKLSIVLMAQFAIVLMLSVSVMADSASFKNGPFDELMSLTLGTEASNIVRPAWMPLR